MTRPLFKNIRSEILNELNKATSEIKVAMGWFTNEDLFDALCEKVKAGLLVELIILNDFINNRKNGLNFQHFINIGGHFYFGNDENPMHNKTCIIDKQVLINGSYNWTYYAESKNEENTIIHNDDSKLIDAFIANFERLKNTLAKVKKVIPNSPVEIYSLNYSDTYHYLAFDFIEKAKFKSEPTFIREAFELLPKNLFVQQAAVEHKLARKRRTTISIGNEIKGNVLSEIIPSGTVLPATGSSNFTTTVDDQVSCNNKIRYGINPLAAKNALIGSYNITGIPKMKAGEPSLILKWDINVNGILTIIDIIKQTSNSVTITYDINHLLEEIND